MTKRIYFDNNATTKLANQALEVMVAVYNEPFNPSAIHYFGRNANNLIDESRNKIKQLTNADNYQVIFTSGGTESNNLALLGFENYKIITSAIEHPSIYNTASKKDSILVKVNQEGVVDIKDLEQIIEGLNDEKFIVSVMMANNETGAIQPVKEIADIVHKKGGLIHSDAVQALGKIDIDLKDLDIDLLSISAHKINGPQGVGALLIKEGLDINPISYGGFQEKGKRAGTHNVAGISGFGKAAQIAEKKVKQYKDIAKLRDYLEDELKNIAKDNLIIFSKNTKRLANTSFIALKGIDNQTQLINLDLNNIAVSIGSACSSGSSKPSQTLKAMGFNDQICKNAIRISLGEDNTIEEINRFLKIIISLTPS